MKIIYLGHDSPTSTSFHRANALSRLGHEVLIEDPYTHLVLRLNNRIESHLHYNTGYRLIQNHICRWIVGFLREVISPDLIWINGGELIGTKVMKLLNQVNCPMLLYNNDDPTGGRDGHRFDMLLQSLPYYDLCTVVRPPNVVEFENRGAKRVFRVYMSYDEVAHQPFANEDDIPSEFRSDVAFIGTWMRYEKRDEFLLELIRQGVPVSIWGDRWQKSPYFKALKPYYRGGSLGGQDYVAAIQGAKLCLGLLSKGNRDLHTQRSLEVPFAGGLLCAERTSEHLALYTEGQEAVFWSDVDECAQVCHKLLRDDRQREAIRLAGMRKVRSLRLGNEDICQAILNEVFNR